MDDPELCRDFCLRYFQMAGRHAFYYRAGEFRGKRPDSDLDFLGNPLFLTEIVLQWNKK